MFNEVYHGIVGSKGQKEYYPGNTYDSFGVSYDSNPLCFDSLQGARFSIVEVVLEGEVTVGDVIYIYSDVVDQYSTYDTIYKSNQFVGLFGVPPFEGYIVLEPSESVSLRLRDPKRIHRMKFWLKPKSKSNLTTKIKSLTIHYKVEW
jgi:hypothetical protein